MRGKEGGEEEIAPEVCPWEYLLIVGKIELVLRRSKLTPRSLNQI
jgi:hypothetical protein